MSAINKWANGGWRNVPVPNRMAGLRRDERGYPVPFVVLWDADDKPLFTVNDDRLTMKCMSEDRCHICGHELEGDYNFVGGPLSFAHPQGGFYIDGPSHHECATYALQVCPYMAAPKYVGRIDAAKMAANTQVNVLMDQTLMPDRPDCFVLGRADSYNVTWPLTPLRKYIPISFGEPRTIAGRFSDFEVWAQGEPIDDEQRALQMIRDALAAEPTRRKQSPQIIPVQRVAEELD